MFCLSPQGQKFRSRASLHAFLLKNKDEILDISVFDFTTPKDKSITTPQILPSQVKQRRTKKKLADGQQETAQDATEILDPPPNKSKKVPSYRRSTKQEKVKNTKDMKPINTDIVLEEVTHGLEVRGDKTEETEKCCIHVTPSASVQDVRPQNSLQRVGLLREKLFRLAPSSNQNTLIVHEDEKVVSPPSLPTLNVEPATESESEDEDERGRDETQIHSKGDNKPSSELEADADSQRHVEEEVLPDNTGGSCTPVRDSQNSKYDLHCLTVCKSSNLS